MGFVACIESLYWCDWNTKMLLCGGLRRRATEKAWILGSLQTSFTRGQIPDFASWITPGPVPLLPLPCHNGLNDNATHFPPILWGTTPP
jgi:hypothetical protein